MKNHRDKIFLGALPSLMLALFTGLGCGASPAVSPGDGGRNGPGDGNGGGSDGGPAAQLLVNRIYATPAWIFFSTWGIRSAGDNFGNVEPNGATVFANALGDVVYVVAFTQIN